MGRDGNTRPVPFSMGIPVPLTPMVVMIVLVKNETAWGGFRR